MADKKIPLLTDVYQPKPIGTSADGAKSSDWVDLKPRQDDTTVITPELIARIAAHIKPRLEADIVKSVTERVCEALKTETSTRIRQDLDQEMQAFQAQALGNQQVQLGEALAENYQTLHQVAKQELAQHMHLLQADILSQMSATLNAAIPSIYAAAVDDVKARFADEMTTQSLQLRANFLATVNADLPAVQAVMRESIQQSLATSLPSLALDLRQQLMSELQDLLLKVKFVLPK